MNSVVRLSAWCCVVLVCACSKKLREEAPVGDVAADRIEVTGSRIVADLPPPLALEAPTPMSIPAPPPPPPPASPPVPIAHDEPVADAPPSAAAISSLHRTLVDPVSTFSIDVDTGSYSLARRQLRDGYLPAAASVRTEEFLNYFDHGYPAPDSTRPPFALSTELAAAPWNPQRLLLQVGIQGYRVDVADLPPANLVFLIDTSGSMQDADKLPLLKQGFDALLRNLRAQDQVAIVAYAGAAGLVLPATAGDQHARIRAALEDLQAGGSTNGGAGIELAYQVARQNFHRDGINRVILATDGDFNVGTTSLEQLKQLVATQRRSGIALTTLGFGAYGYNGELAEQLADIGDGNHAYIDDPMEARRVLVSEMGATLLTIARDVKIQLEFNPQQVLEYRLLGYENRALRRQDFIDDRVDAGEIGAGHDVTALYELRLAPATSDAAALAWLRLRYKEPTQAHSQLIEQPVRLSGLQAVASGRLQFAAAVAAFAERLRGSSWLGDFDYPAIAELLAGLPAAEHPERAELRDLVELAALLEQR